MRLCLNRTCPDLVAFLQALLRSSNIVLWISPSVKTPISIWSLPSLHKLECWAYTSLQKKEKETLNSDENILHRHVPPSMQTWLEDTYIQEVRRNLESHTTSCCRGCWAVAERVSLLCRSLQLSLGPAAAMHSPARQEDYRCWWETPLCPYSAAGARPSTGLIGSQ